MAKWLNKYFSLGNNNNNKTKSPPQPPRPDYKKNGGTDRSFHLSQQQQQFPQYHHHTSPLPGHCREESDLIRAYRAQKERDFEDPYNGPGSSLRKLRAMCREEQQEEGIRGSGSLFQEPYPGSSTNTTSSSSSSSSSPHLYRSNSERRPARARQQQQLLGGSELKYIVSPKHRLIKIESCGWGDSGGSTGTAAITWSPALTAAGTKSEEPSNPGGKKEKLVIPDDYSDPFDAKGEKNKGLGPENNGYMEPYEAQRLMTDIQKQESQKPPQKNIQLYDTPYEPECNGVEESDSESLIDLRLRESKLPQDDDRPADEYDQPWEWNKALPALAAQFNGGEKRQSSPSPSSDRRRQLRTPGGGFKPIKHGSPELCGILGERVDPNVALEKQTWYHGAISRTDAENLLRLCKECSYLVRNSQTSKHDYSLSLKSSQGFMHMKLSKTKEKYILGQNSPPFDSVPEVIHFYTTRKLPIKGAEHLSLLYPVAVRTL